MSSAQSFVAIGGSLVPGGVAGLWAGRSAGFVPGERIGSSAAAGKEEPVRGYRVVRRIKTAAVFPSNERIFTFGIVLQ